MLNRQAAKGGKQSFIPSINVRQNDYGFHVLFFSDRALSAHRKEEVGI